MKHIVLSHDVLCLQVYFWDYSRHNDLPNVRGAASAGAVVEGLMIGPKAACNGLALNWLLHPQSKIDFLHVVSAYEDGSVMHQQLD